MNRTLFQPWIRSFLILVLVVAVPLLLYALVYVQQRVDAERQRAFGVLAAVSSELKERVRAYNSIAISASTGGRTKEEVRNFLRSLPNVRVLPSVPPAANPTLRPKLSSDGQGGLEFTVGDSKCSHNDSPCPIVAHVSLETLVPWYLVESEFDGMLIFDGTDNNGKSGLLTQDRRLPVQPLGVPITLHSADRLMSLKEFLETRNGVDSPRMSPLDLRNEWQIRLGGADYLPFIQRLTVPIENPTGEKPTGKSSEQIQFIVCGLIESNRFKREAIALPPHALVTVASFALLGLLVIPFLKLRFIGRNERMRPGDIWLLGGSVLGATALLVLLVLHQYSISLLQARFDSGLRSFASSVASHATREVGLVRDQLSDRTAVGTLLTDASRVTTTVPPVARGSILTQREFTYPLLEAFFYAGKDERGHDAQQLSKLMARTIPTNMVDVGALPYFPNGLTVQPPDIFTFSPDIARTSGLRLGVFAIPASLRNFKLKRAGPWAGQEVPVVDRDGIVTLATPLPSLNDSVVSLPFQFVVLHRGTVVFQSAKGPYRGERFFGSIPNGELLMYDAQSYLDGNVPGPRRMTYHGRSYRMVAIRLTAFPVSEAPQTPAEMDLVAYYDERSVESLAAQAFTTGALLALVVIILIVAGASIARLAFGNDALAWAWPSALRNRWYRAGIAGALLLATLLVSISSRLPLSLAPWFLVAVPGFAIFVAAALSFYLERQVALASDAELEVRVTAHARRVHPILFVVFGVSALVAMVAVPAALAFDYGLAYSAARFEENAAKRLESDWAGRPPLRDQPFVRVSGFGSGALADASNMVDSPPHLICRLEKDKESAAQSDVRCATTERIYARPDNYDLTTNLEKALRRYDTCVELLESASCTCRLDRSSPDIRQHVIARPCSSIEAVTFDPSTWLAPFKSGRGELARLIGAKAAVARAESPLGMARPAIAPPQSALTLAAVTANIDSDSLLATKVPGVLAQLRERLTTATAMFGQSLGPAAELLLVLAILAFLVRSVSKHVLGLDVSEVRVLDRSDILGARAEGRWLLLRPPESALSELLTMGGVRVIDLRDPRLCPSSLASDEPQGEAILVIQHVEHRLAEPAWRSALLKLIMGGGQRSIVLVCDIDPFHYLAQRLREQADPTASGDPQETAAPVAERDRAQAEVAAWASVLRDFEKVRYDLAPISLNGTEEPTSVQEIGYKLIIECRYSDTLRRIAADLIQRKELARYDWHEIVRLILDAAEPYYRSIWDLCSRDEKLVLIQLAEEGLVNPKRIELVRRLARRRLVHIDPRFRLINDSFRMFIRSAEPPERVAEWESVATTHAWRRVGVPLYTLGAVVIAILLYTEQSLFTSVLAIATGTVGALGSLRSLYAQARLPALTKPG